MPGIQKQRWHRACPQTTYHLVEDGDTSPAFRPSGSYSTALSLGFINYKTRDGVGVWSQHVETIIRRMSKQQRPAVQPRELYSISYDKT